MPICECCGQVIRKPKSAKINSIPDPVPDPDRPGWWLYIHIERLGVFGATVFISGKELTADKKRREALSRKYNAKEREARAYDPMPLYWANLPRIKELDAIIAYTPERPDYNADNYCELMAAYEVDVTRNKERIWEAVKERIDLICATFRHGEERKRRALKSAASFYKVKIGAEDNGGGGNRNL